MNSGFLNVIIWILNILFLLTPLFLVFLILFAARLNRDSVPRKEKVVAFVGFWRRVAIGTVNIIISIFIIPIIFNIFYYLRDGQTIGDKIYGTKIVDKKTMKLASVGKLLMREFAKTLSVLCLGFGFFAAGVRSEKRAWHDEWAGIRYISYKKIHGIWTFIPLFLVFILPIFLSFILS